MQVWEKCLLNFTVLGSQKLRVGEELWDKPESSDSSRYLCSGTFLIGAENVVWTEIEQTVLDCSAPS